MNKRQEVQVGIQTSISVGLDVENKSQASCWGLEDLDVSICLKSIAFSGF